jgi:hypothetical protein
VGLAAGHQTTPVPGGSRPAPRVPPLAATGIPPQVARALGALRPRRAGATAVDATGVDATPGPSARGLRRAADRDRVTAALGTCGPAAREIREHRAVARATMSEGHGRQATARLRAAAVAGPAARAPTAEAAQAAAQAAQAARRRAA